MYTASHMRVEEMTNALFRNNREEILVLADVNVGKNVARKFKDSSTILRGCPCIFTGNEDPRLFDRDGTNISGVGAVNKPFARRC